MQEGTSLIPFFFFKKWRVCLRITLMTLWDWLPAILSHDIHWPACLLASCEKVTDSLNFPADWIQAWHVMPQTMLPTVLRFWSFFCCHVLGQASIILAVLAMVLRVVREDSFLKQKANPLPVPPMHISYFPIAHLFHFSCNVATVWHLSKFFFLCFF